MLPICCDFFDNNLWTYFSSRSELWTKPSAVYFSNAAIYSLNMGIQSSDFSVSTPYHPDTYQQIPGASVCQHRFLFSRQEERYELVATQYPPSPDEILGSFCRRANR